MSLSAGTRLGPYEILSPLGAGGMGEVYRARDTRLGRDVAVKVLPQHLSQNPEVRSRFEREAKTVSGLNHPHICTLFDVGRDRDTDYLVMELIEGETLAARLAKGALPTPEVLKIGVQIAGALSRAHRAGIVHRDLKPGNIMLTRSGAKLMDFGLARPTGLSGPSGSGVTIGALTQSPTIAQPLTAEGTIVGTFQYMAPEQLEGKEADARSDIWSLGCVLYEMATGKAAFEGKSQASLIAAILEHEPPAVASIQPTSPASLDRLLRACLAKDPDDRVQTAQDVKLQLEWMQADSGARPEAAESAPPSSRRARRARLLLAALPLMLAAAAFFAGRQSAPRPTTEQLQFVRKTYRQQAIFTARFTPDSKTIVLSSALEGNTPRLYVIRPEYPEPQPVGVDGVHLLAVSSRGELAVLTNAHYTGHHRLFAGTLARMPMEGAAPREVMENVREADWSPDGADLAVIHDVGGTDRLEFPIGTVLYQSAGYLSDPRVSPNGEWVAFMEHPAKFDNRGSVNVVDRKGSARLLTGGYWGMEGTAWTPDGSAILFSATLNGSDYQVREVDLEGRARPARHNVGMVIIHDIARDGTWALTRDDLPSRITFRPAGSTDEVDLSWLDAAVLPVLSGDGKMLALTDQSILAGPNYAAAIRPTSGGAIIRLGEGAGTQFSPDGKSVLGIVFSTPPRLMSYPVGAGAAVRLDRGGLENISDARWMPDGKRVLVNGNESGRPARVFLLDPSAGRLEPVGPEGTWDGIPSPDGTSFAARSRAGWSVYPISGAAEGRPVPSMTHSDLVIRWSPDGSALYSLQRDEIPSRVERVDVATGKRESVALLGASNRAGLVSVLSASMADDMRTLAYSAWYYSSVLYTAMSASPENTE